MVLCFSCERINMTYESQNTFATDITGYGRKMGRDAGILPEGRLDGVHYLGPVSDGIDGWMPSGSIAARTMNPANGESQGGGLGRGNFWGVNRINNVSGSGSPQIWDTNYPRN